MNSPGHILIIEDDPAILMTLRRVLTEEGHHVTAETRGDAGLELAASRDFDLVLSDMKLPGLDGLDLVRELHRRKPRLPIVLMTAHGTSDTAIQATQSGAIDYLLKPFEMPELIQLVSRSIAASRLMSKPVDLGESTPNRDALVGTSRAMQNIYKEIGRIASKPVNVLIRGETGTGKELIARAVYQHSDRVRSPFVAINCAAIPETLLESELFGHERGAFTGAEFRRIGRFEQADHGTIFLDEIGDMKPGTQVKLLRVLQEKTLHRLGGKETIPVDVRVIAATHQDLETAMQHRTFREDLYYRLSVVVLTLPPLRERKEDIPDLVNYFLRKFGMEFEEDSPSIHPDALAFLQMQTWPGNVRELENTIRKALLLARGYTISIDHLRATLLPAAPPASTSQASLREKADELLAAAQRGEVQDAHARLLEEAEREIFRRAIELARGNQAKAARWLGVSRLTMREKLIRFGLHPGRGN
ncbi:MAG: sigma-54 dependent transcriptional regulator [Verrucomicrobiota bacterium]